MRMEDTSQAGEQDQQTGSNADPTLRWQRTALAAFYRAEARGFAPGGELDDWLEAERDLDAQPEAASASVAPASAAGGSIVSNGVVPVAATPAVAPEASAAPSPARKRPAAKRSRQGRGVAIQANARTGDEA